MQIFLLAGLQARICARRALAQLPGSQICRELLACVSVCVFGACFVFNESRSSSSRSQPKQQNSARSEPNQEISTLSVGHLVERSNHSSMLENGRKNMRCDLHGHEELESKREKNQPFAMEGMSASQTADLNTNSINTKNMNKRVTQTQKPSTKHVGTPTLRVNPRKTNQ